MAKENINKSLQKGLLVMRTLAAAASELTLSQIASRTDLPVGSAHRYITTLESMGYIKKNPGSRRYQLTPKVFELGFANLMGMELRTRVLPYLLEASSEFNTTTACSVLDGGDIIYVERARSVGLVNLDLSIGSRLPAYCTAMGKAILAFIDEAELEEILAKIKLIPVTAHTIIDKDALRADLRETRERGYALCRQELRLGLHSMGAPIFRSGKVEAAISFNLPYQAEPEHGDLFKNMLDRLLLAAKEVSIA